MTRVRFIILCAFFGFILVSSFLLINTRLTGARLGALKNMLPANVDMRLSNLVLNEAGENGRRLALNAASAQYFKREDLFVLSDVAALVASESGTLNVKAEQGRYAPEQKKVVLSGQVRTEDDEGRILTGSKLALNMDDGILTSQEEFCLEDPRLSLSGRGFVYNSRTGVLEVEGRILFMINL
ncbi:MAG: LPS export ABC transporter periplasmic protein LptC [Deltaproteobacteria bacterium]|jgi:LPS export ABC transporter protein LptC|nr:LPS export ABC transporter periplasmic protein LptC [Deltaproteobacteria bacterium]